MSAFLLRELATCSFKKQLQLLFQFKAPVKSGSVQRTNGTTVSGKGATGKPIISNFIKAPMKKTKEQVNKLLLII